MAGSALSGELLGNTGRVLPIAYSLEPEEMLWIPSLSGLLEPSVLQPVLCKAALPPGASSMAQGGSGLPRVCAEALPVLLAWSAALGRELSRLLAVCSGRLAHGEDERSQLHSVIHARGHATEGERVHHEGVQIRHEVNARSSAASAGDEPQDWLLSGGLGQP